MAEKYQFEFVHGQYRIYKDTFYVATVHTESSASVIVNELNSLHGEISTERQISDINNGSFEAALSTVRNLKLEKSRLTTRIAELEAQLAAITLDGSDESTAPDTCDRCNGSSEFVGLRGVVYPCPDCNPHASVAVDDDTQPMEPVQPLDNEYISPEEYYSQVADTQAQEDMLEQELFEARRTAAESEDA